MTTAEPTRPLAKRERTALSLDIVRSRLMKRPGTTLETHRQFSLFRDYVRERLEANQSLIASWSGDGLLALFAEPRQGVECALSILNGLSAFNASPDVVDAIQIRMGIHDGAILMGEDEPLGEVISLTLDIAGYLQKHCQPDGILISESTYLGLADTTGWSRAHFDAELNASVYTYTPPSPEEALEGLTPRAAASPTYLRVRMVNRAGSLDVQVHDEAVIGRLDRDTARIPDIAVRADDAVSRRHARIFLRDGRFFVEDLRSTNGTELNGQRLAAEDPALLYPGDAIQVGDCTRLYVLGIETAR